MKNLQLSSGLLCVLSVLNFSTPTLAQDSETMEMPSLEFLEFLGNFENDEGTWQDPFETDDENNPIEINKAQGEKQ